MLIKVKNLSEYVNNAISPQVLSRALDKIGLLIEASAKEKCPVDTGTLRSSIGVLNKTNDSISVGSNLDYAPYVEYGTGLFSSQGDGRQTPWVYKTADGRWHYTKGNLPQPYLEPAITENRDKIIEIIKDEIEKELTRGRHL